MLTHPSFSFWRYFQIFTAHTARTIFGKIWRAANAKIFQKNCHCMEMAAGFGIYSQKLFIDKSQKSWYNIYSGKRDVAPCEGKARSVGFDSLPMMAAVEQLPTTVHPHSFTARGITTGEQTPRLAMTGLTTAPIGG